MRRAAILGGVALAAIGLSSTAFAQKTKLTVYTAIENEQLEPFKKAFEADNPTIEIAWVRDSTGVMTAKLIAEKDNPRADVVWGLAASSVGLMGSMGMIEPYTPSGAAALKPIFKSGKNPETWVGMDAYLAVLCFNTAEAEKNKKPKPTSWADLTKPEYKDFDRDAEPGLVGHRLSHGRGLAHHHGRGGGLEVHGRPAPERRRSTCIPARRPACRPPRASA